MNIISKLAVEKMSLKIEPHPQPYDTCVDYNFHTIIQWSCAYLVFEL